MRMVCLSICLIIFLSLSSQDGSSDSFPVPLGESSKELVKVTEHGFDPPVQTIKKPDGSLFIVNATVDSLITIEIGFNGRRLHCLSGNLKVTAQGNLRTNTPVAPKDFVISCFPEPGSYDLIAQGIGAQGRKVQGRVIVAAGQ